MTDFKDKKLRRSSTDRMFAGVIGGIAEYLEVDSTALRVAWVLIVVFTGFFPGVLGYIVMMIVMPVDGATHNGSRVHDMPPKAE